METHLTAVLHTRMLSDMDGDGFYATLVYREASGGSGGVEDSAQYRLVNGPIMMTATRGGNVTGVRVYHKGMCVSQMPVKDIHVQAGDRVHLDLKVTDAAGNPVNFGEPPDAAEEAAHVEVESKRLRDLLDRLQSQLDLMGDWQPRPWVDVQPKEEFL